MAKWWLGYRKVVEGGIESPSFVGSFILIPDGNQGIFLCKM